MHLSNFKKYNTIHYVSAVYPTKKLGKIRAQVKDPTMEGAEIDFDINKGLEIYYLPVIRLLKSSHLQYHFRKQRIYF